MLKPLRIAFVTETFPPDVNGVATSLAQLVRGLVARNHHIQLIRPANLDGLGKAENESGSETVGLGYEELLLPSIPVPTYQGQRMGWPELLALYKLWSKRRPDVVHIVTEGPLGWAALQIARALAIPISTDFRTNFHTYSEHYGLGWLKVPILGYLRHFHNSAHSTFVPTAALAGELDQQGFRNLRVVARGVDTERFSPHHRSSCLRAKWGARDSTLVLLYVGRLAAEKNLEVLIQTFEAIRLQNHEVRLVLVGHGPMAESLCTRCPEAIQAGPRSGLDLSAHYASADLFLFPSLTDTFGNVTLEALASGVPVVAFAKGAAALLVDTGVNGACVQAMDNVSFVASALKLVAPPHQLGRLGEAARERALDLSWSKVVERFERELVTLLPPAMPAGADESAIASVS